MIRERIKNFIIEKALLSKGETVIVGFSGGADSACLLHVLVSLKDELGIKIVAAHLHHGIRGKEADDDVNVARAFCGKYDIPFFVEYKNIPQIAKDEGISCETAGRTARYEFFNSLMEKLGASKIATAHNKNDNAETILHHIIRGSGIDGLSGIPEKRGNVIRPILFLSREEIEEYCAENNISFVIDSTNLSDDYTRNKIRNGLLPYLKEFNPNIMSSIVSLGDCASADKDYMEQETAQIYEKYVKTDDYGTYIETENFEKLHNALQRRLILFIGKKQGIEFEHKHINLLLGFLKEKETGKKLNFPGGCVVTSYGKLYFVNEQTKSENFFYELHSGENFINGKTIICENPDNHKVVFRTRQDGDTIVINNMHKKVKKVLIDKKVPQHLRDKLGIITINEEPAIIPTIAEGDITKKLNVKVKI